MKDTSQSRQLSALLLMALSAPAVMVCPKQPWPWVVAMALFAAAAVLGLRILCAAQETSLAELTLSVWGRVGGTAVLGGTAVFCLLLLWQLTPLMAQAFPETADSPFVPLTLLALSAWAACRGQAAVLRAAGALSFFPAALYAAVLLFALPNADFSRLASWPQTDLLPLGILLLPALGLFLAPGHGSKPPVTFALLSVLLPSAVAALCAAVPGSRGSFYEMAKSVEVLGLTRRIEPMVSALLTVGWFAACVLPTLCVGHLAQACGLPQRWASAAFCVLAVPAAVVKIKIPNGLLLLLGTIFCVIFPVLTLLLGPENIFQKFFKKTKKRC